ncbi:oligoribonuclease [Catenovulum sediminis]|uniref:oligoribonuclease n=1 Tax=Catenovulum sediminis TaxID=1740262 RepID=UPI00117F629B|nr:oligoribonuclease [Catenovulum sediminis]
MSQFILWLDLETGGLDGRLDNGKLGMEFYPILEIACVLTDTNLNPVSAIRIPLFQPESELNKLSNWAVQTHHESGLLAECMQSDITLDKAERIVLNWLASNGCDAYDRAAKTGAVLAGNSIGFDRNFIRCQMPKLHSYLHYRMLDVSAVALMCRFSRPELEALAVEHKTYKHEALSDIFESIKEYFVYSRFVICSKDFDTSRLGWLAAFNPSMQVDPSDFVNPKLEGAA